MKIGISNQPVTSNIVNKTNGGQLNVFAAGQSLAAGHFSSQQTASTTGRDTFLSNLRNIFSTVNFIDGANGGSYAARTSADIDVWKSSSPSNPYSVTNGSNIITITYTNHDTRVGALINLAGGTAVGGINPFGNYRVISIVNSNTFTVQHGSNATSTTIGGGTPTITLYNPEFWWNNSNETPGPMLLDLYNIIDTSGLVPHLILWAQGEADSFSMPSPTTAAEHKRVCLAIFNALRTRYGTQLKVMIQGSPARRTSFNRSPNYQLIREGYQQLVTENPTWIFHGGDTYPYALHDAVHPVDVGYTGVAERNARSVAVREGKVSNGANGPVPISVSRSGSNIDITFQHDAGNDFNLTDFHPSGSLANFFTVFEYGARLTITNTTKISANTIRLTVSNTPIFNLDIYGGFDAMLTADLLNQLDLTKVPFDNAPLPMPIRPFRLSHSGVAFSPNQIANLDIWFDAADTATITSSGGLVSQWNDKSGNARHATAAGAARSTVVSNSINGLTAIYSNGASGIGMTFAHPYTNTSNLTMFTLFRGDTGTTDPTTSTTNGIVSISPTGGVAACYAGLRQTSNSHGVVQGLFAGVGQTLGNGSSYTNARVYTGRIDATNVAGWDNGTSRFNLARGAGPFTINSTATIFNDAPISAARAAVGSIGENLTYGRALTDIERQQVEFYLTQKWGVV